TICFAVLPGELDHLLSNSCRDLGRLNLRQRVLQPPPHLGPRRLSLMPHHVRTSHNRVLPWTRPPVSSVLGSPRTLVAGGTTAARSRSLGPCRWPPSRALWSSVCW